MFSEVGDFVDVHVVQRMGREEYANFIFLLVQSLQRTPGFGRRDRRSADFHRIHAFEERELGFLFGLLVLQTELG